MLDSNIVPQVRYLGDFSYIIHTYDSGLPQSAYPEELKCAVNYVHRTMHRLLHQVGTDQPIFGTFMFSEAYDSPNYKLCGNNCSGPCDIVNYEQYHKELAMPKIYYDPKSTTST